MNQPRLRVSVLLLALGFVAGGAFATESPAPGSAASDFNVKNFGAAGDGKTIDTAAINGAIEAASSAGGGTVLFPAGTYASYSIHLRSNVSLYLGAGATLMAAQPSADLSAGYDAPEPNSPVDQYEDFGHSHWHNSLIWGERVHDITISGPGRIYGYGLSKGAAGTLRDPLPEEHWAHVSAPPVPAHPAPAAPAAKLPFGYGAPSAKDTLLPGIGNKSIALKECRNISIKDITIYHGGHFAILATACDNVTYSNLKIDTNRDGLDIDSCRNMHVSDCSVNSPGDDGICPKSDYGQGYNRACENITITNCCVSGFDEGTFLAGTYGREHTKNPNGRIKFGTEGNGGFKNIAISNCTFDYCRGLALEEVDGGWLEDVSITNLTMRDVPNSPIYIRLGARNRGPAGTETGFLRRVIISNVVAYNVDSHSSAIISGVPGHPIEDLTLSNIVLFYRGGGTAADAKVEPAELETGYPEPSRHGTMPAYGFFLRHVKGISMHDIDIRTMAPDARPPFVLEDVADAEFDHVKAPHAAGVPSFVLRKVTGLEVDNSPGIPDTHRSDSIADEKL